MSADVNIKDVEIAVPLKYLSNKINLILTWSTNCVINDSTDAGALSITDTKLYIPLVTLPT